MYTAKAGPPALRNVCRFCREIPALRTRRSSRRQLSSQSSPFNNTSSRKTLLRSAGILLVLGAGAVTLNGSQWSPLRLQQLEAESKAAAPAAELQIENTKRKKGLSKEENRDMISSQHLQVKRSWENPGVYAWGSNSGRVAAPNSDDSNVRTPRRIAYFDGMLLRDVKLDRTFGAAITEKGDLVQWGTGFADDCWEPTPTLTGKGLKSLAISRDRILALSSSGTVYSLPVSRSDQQSGAKPIESSWWLPFYSSSASISYRTVSPPTKSSTFSSSEKVVSLASGLDHALLLTSAGRVFAFASSSSDFPSRGQLGIPGLTWATRPTDKPYDMPHEITTLRGFQIASVAAGDTHSLALDKDGRVFVFGDNSQGQLGIDMSSEAPFVPAPSLLPIDRVYAGTSLHPTCTGIFAGGANSFFSVFAEPIVFVNHDYSPSSSSSSPPSSSSNSMSRPQFDLFSSGSGILGTLGTGRWTHVAPQLTKIRSFSGLYEWDEVANRVIPIKLASLSAGATHVAATMANVTHLGAHSGSSENDTNWGADVLFWGGNEYFQLGTGRRNNMSVPGYIGPMDRDDAALSGSAKGGKSSSTGNGKGGMGGWGKGEEHRFQITPKGKVRIDGRMKEVEQRVECGRYVTAVYSGL
ncbi:hypothetical protein MMC25_002313 [Agyrium rufum]|nr:hypothetical protein [Agyrium rufum]